MIDWANLTWTCHVCKEERPDAKIGVHSEKRILNGVEFQTNVRYCVDRESCRDGARDVDFLKGAA